MVIDQELLNIVGDIMAKAYSYNCPCKKCNKRIINCHSFCEDYNKWKRNGVEKSNKVYVPDDIIKKKGVS